MSPYVGRMNSVLPDFWAVSFVFSYFGKSIINGAFAHGQSWTAIVPALRQAYRPVFGSR